MRIATVSSIAGLAAIAFAAAADTAATSAVGAAAPTGDGLPRWSYEGPSGPAHWGELDESFAACATGRMQSPIDLGAANAEGSIVVSVHYSPVTLTILNNGHTVQFDGNGAGELVSQGTGFKLVRVHFHTPAEHAVHGQRMPLDAHFVHKADDGRLAVLAVSFVEGPANPVLATLLARLPEQSSDPQTYPDVTIDPSGLLPSDMTVYRYMGSLTTPPCTEGVNWYVPRGMATASKEQIARLTTALGTSARPVQPLNDRLLVAPPKSGS